MFLRRIKWWLLGKVDRVVTWMYVHRIYGPKCPDFNEDCHTCRMWKEYEERYL